MLLGHKSTAKFAICLFGLWDKAIMCDGLRRESESICSINWPIIFLLNFLILMMIVILFALYYNHELMQDDNESHFSQTPNTRYSYSKSKIS
jgi:hypothetical protein